MSDRSLLEFAALFDFYLEKSVLIQHITFHSFNSSLVSISIQVVFEYYLKMVATCDMYNGPGLLQTSLLLKLYAKLYAKCLSK